MQQSGTGWAVVYTVIYMLKFAWEGDVWGGVELETSPSPSTPPSIPSLTPPSGDVWGGVELETSPSPSTPPSIPPLINPALSCDVPKSKVDHQLLTCSPHSRAASPLV